jgi:hypothetical protein
LSVLAKKESQKLMKELGGKVIAMPYFKNQSSTLIKSKFIIDLKTIPNKKF